MSDNKVLGWCSLGLFAIAVLILAYVAALLIFFPNAAFVANVNAQVLFVVSGLLGLIAAVLGFLLQANFAGENRWNWWIGLVDRDGDSTFFNAYHQCCQAGRCCSIASGCVRTPFNPINNVHW